MRFSDSLSNRLPEGRRRRSEATRITADAYRALFSGKGKESDATLVLTDLANTSGFFKAMGPGFDADARSHQDGQRALFARIYRFLRMTERELITLQEAARIEALTDADEGTI